MLDTFCDVQSLLCLPVSVCVWQGAWLLLSRWRADTPALNFRAITLSLKAWSAHHVGAGLLDVLPVCASWCASCLLLDVLRGFHARLPDLLSLSFRRHLPSLLIPPFRRHLPSLLIPPFRRHLPSLLILPFRPASTWPAHPAVPPASTWPAHPAVPPASTFPALPAIPPGIYLCCFILPFPAGPYLSCISCVNNLFKFC